MSRFRTLSLALLPVCALALAGCQSSHHASHAGHGAMGTKAAVDLAPTTAAAAAGLAPTGRVTFTELAGGKVLVEARIAGLKPNSEHGFHVHAVPDCSGDGMKTGAHFNPDNHPHAHPGERTRHAGALFNLKTDASGVGQLRQEADTITLTGGKYNIVGMPLITHRDPDDYKSQPLGNAGPRVACGIITKA